MTQLQTQEIAAMDDTAAWAASNPVALPSYSPGPTANEVLRQSLNHFCNAGLMTIAQERHAHALLRAHFLKAEADVLLGEQWAEYEAEVGKASRADGYHFNTCIYLWKQWDERMHNMYFALLERAEAAEAEAKYGSAKL